VLGADRTRLNFGDVHVWRVPIERHPAPAFTTHCLSLLDSEETFRLEQLQAGPLYAEYLVTRALCRTTLSRYAGVPPQAWRFSRNQHGRPEIAVPSLRRPLYFSLSHASGFAACAVARHGDVGVDVESRYRGDVNLSIARRYFSPAEYRSLLTAAPDSRSELFLRLWTLKEAYVKATGLGLRLRLNSFSIEVTASGAFLSPTDADDSIDSWQLSSHCIDDVFLFAVCVRRHAGHETRIEFFDAKQHQPPFDRPATP
jgi:4'-phosphopantetheinyl transferase